MPRYTVRTPDDGSEWSDERLAVIRNASVMIGGEPCPVVEATVDGGSALLVIDTGDLDLEPGTVTDAGTVE